jgi:tryptophanyl-tRNA synthetase
VNAPSSFTTKLFGEGAAAPASTASAATIPVSTTNGEAGPTPKKVITRRILSGVQPTGSLHLGNYLGAIKQWVEFQNTGKFFPGAQDENEVDGDNNNNTIINENFFCVVDLHAITVPQDPSQLEESTLASAALYIASGIDPTKSKIFVQSHVSAHAELAWLLNCVTPMNWLERMIQYKDKAKKAAKAAEASDDGSASSSNNSGVGVGLFTYPVLMAADILLYQADRVPVGEDQRQHLELARDIVRRFNSEYCRGNQYKNRCKKAGVPSRPVFTEPEAMIVSAPSGGEDEDGIGGVARVMSLTEGTSKMSKSDPSDYSRINILDPPDVIRDKIKKCKTDSYTTGIEWNNPDRPEATNLLNIYAAVQPHRTKEDILTEVTGMKWGTFKPLLAETIVNHLEPIQTKYAAVRADETYLRNVLKEGADAAEAIAQTTLKAAKVAMGFSVPK